MDPPAAKPLTVPPMVKGPAAPPPPPPPPPLDFGKPLQAARRTELSKRDIRKENFSEGFISASLLLVPARDGQAAANSLKNLASPSSVRGNLLGMIEQAMRTGTKLPQEAIPPAARTFLRYRKVLDWSNIVVQCCAYLIINFLHF